VRPRAKSSSVVGVFKNRRTVESYGALGFYGEGFNNTNVFLIPPSYTKTPHACKGLHGRFGRGFFEGAIGHVAEVLV
jgi:hypothetical protein